MVDASDALRLAADYSILGRCILGECPYQVYLVNIQNDQVSYNSTPSQTPTITTTRLTVADGYQAFAPGDGYLNPPVKQLSGEQVVLSGGALTDNMLVLGPISFPYGQFGISGGLDPIKFQPDSGTNTQVFVQLKGPGLNPDSGNYFAVKQIILDGMKNITYNVLIEAIAALPLT